MTNTSRPDSYVLALTVIKNNVRTQIMQHQAFLSQLQKIVSDENYATAATDLEKSNITMMTTMTTDMLAQLKMIVWE